VSIAATVGSDSGFLNQARIGIEASSIAEAEILGEFRDFLFRGNIVELAVAFVMGLAVAAVVNSLVGNLLMP
jgi:hypothetical protein